MAQRLAQEVILPASQVVGDKAQPMAEEIIAQYIDPVADAITQQVRIDSRAPLATAQHAARVIRSDWCL